MNDSPSTAGDRDARARQLMMESVDGEISPQGREELQALLSQAPHLREEWRQFQHLKEVTQMTRLAQLPDSAFAGYWQSVYNRIERAGAWILLSIGALIVGSWSLWHVVQDILADTSVPWLVRIGVFALLFGGLILMLSVAREKLSVRRTDPFEEVER